MPEPPQHTGLTRETIIDAALVLLDEVGLDGLTVRRLASELEVQNPTLYWHFRNKQELLDGMADTIVRSPGMGPPFEEESWEHWLRRRTRAYRHALLAHRDAARVVSSARILSDSTLQAFEQELAVLVERGFAPALALRTLTAISAYTEGFVLREQRRAAGAAGSRDVLEGIELPILTEALRDTQQTGNEDVFEHGLRALVDGAAAALNRPRERPGS